MTDLVVTKPTTPALLFDTEQIDLIKRTIAKGATDDQLKMFLHHCKRTGLDPFAKQLYCVIRKSNKPGELPSMSIQTSIDGFRLIAQRSGEYAGQVGPYWCGPDGVWTDVWLSEELPKASKVGVLRKGFTEPCFAVARFDSYAQTSTYNGVTSLTKFWRSMPEIMIAKCAESLALRKAFPQELSGLYTSEEMDQAHDHQPTTQITSATVTDVSQATPTPTNPPNTSPNPQSRFDPENPTHKAVATEFLAKKKAGQHLAKFLSVMAGQAPTYANLDVAWNKINPEAPDVPEE